MIALVDIGNTRIKWTVLADGSLDPSLSAAHPGRLDAAVQALLEGLPHDLERALIANVAGPELWAGLSLKSEPANLLDPVGRSGRHESEDVPSGN